MLTLCEDIKELRILPFYNSDSTSLYIDNLKREIKRECPCMLLKQNMFSLKLIGQTGGKKADKLLEWSNACRKALLLQPSSAASERVFFFCFV